jgi:hypothetical protein
MSDYPENGTPAEQADWLRGVEPKAENLRETARFLRRRGSIEDLVSPPPSAPRRPAAVTRAARLTEATRPRAAGKLRAMRLEECVVLCGSVQRKGT